MQRELIIPWGGWGNAKQIGQGSFGTVYEIERTIGGIQEKAAMKVISIPKNESEINELYADGYNNESVTARYRSQYDSIIREYSLMAKMKGNGNIVYCDDIQSIPHANGIGWDIYIKMELLTPLTTYLGTSLQIPDAAVINIGMDICNALSVCEENGVLHRDIKPQNIFVAKDGRYKLGDFGVAKLSDHTTNATVAGTYRYMAPEVAREEPYSAAADRYSLGIVLYWLLNERRTPFLPLPPSMVSEEQDKLARARRFRGEPVPAPKHGSEWLKQIVLKAIAFNPKSRFASASEMRRALEALKDKDYTTLSACLARVGSTAQTEADQTAKTPNDSSASHLELSTVTTDNQEGTVGRQLPTDNQGGTVGRQPPANNSDETADGTIGRYIPKPEPKEKKRGVGFYVIIGLVALLWIAAIIVVVKLIQNKNNDSPDNEVSSQELTSTDGTAIDTKKTESEQTEDTSPCPEASFDPSLLYGEWWSYTGGILMGNELVDAEIVRITFLEPDQIIVSKSTSSSSKMTDYHGSWEARMLLNGEIELSLNVDVEDGTKYMDIRAVLTQNQLEFTLVQYAGGFLCADLFEKDLTPEKKIEMIKSENAETNNESEPAFNEMEYCLYKEFVEKIPIDSVYGESPTLHLDRTQYSGVIRDLTLTHVVVADIDGNGVPELLLGGPDLVWTDESCFFIFSVKDERVYFSETSINDLRMGNKDGVVSIDIYQNIYTGTRIAVSSGDSKTSSGTWKFIEGTVDGEPRVNEYFYFTYFEDNQGNGSQYSHWPQTDQDAGTYNKELNNYFLDYMEIGSYEGQPVEDNDIVSAFNAAYIAYYYSAYK